MKKIAILIGSVVFIAAAVAQKPGKLIPLEKIPAGAAVHKVIEKNIDKKHNITYTTLYQVESYYQKFDDGIYAEFNTDSGRIICKLHYDKVPLTVCNFVGLAEGTMPNNFRSFGEPYYDSLKFHRVISKANGDGQDFMIQGGDPQGTGAGGPGYNFEDEFHPDLTHSGPGVLSMANSGPSTNGSQFFITHVATPWLNNKHSIFGQVVEGQEVVNVMRSNCKMNSVKIIRKGQAAIEFKADSAAFAAMREGKKKQADFAKYDEEVLKRYPTAHKTASGLWYVINASGNGTPATTGATVDVNYKGSLANGTEFDNSYKRNEPISFNIGIGQVIPGWDEGISMMRVGDKYTLIIPSNLAYGSTGAGQGVIPPNSTLVFETELLKVQEPDKNLDFATNDALVKEQYPNAKKTKTGLWYVVLEEGEGELAEPGDNVSVHYKGMLANGTEFDNSYKRGEPLKFQLGMGNVIPGWDEGIALMKTGSKFLLIIPSKLGYGTRGAGGSIPPNATLIFETELVSTN